MTLIKKPAAPAVPAKVAPVKNEFNFASGDAKIAPYSDPKISSIVAVITSSNGKKAFLSDTFTKKLISYMDKMHPRSEETKVNLGQMGFILDDKSLEQIKRDLKAVITKK